MLMKSTLYKAATRTPVVLGAPMVMTAIIGMGGIISFVATESFLVVPLIAFIQGGLAWVCKDRPDIFIDIKLFVETGGAASLVGAVKANYAPGVNGKSGFFVRSFGPGDRVFKV